MTYKYRLHIIDMDSWSGPDSYFRDYDTKEQAESAKKAINSQNTSKIVPDYYTIAENIEIMEI